MSTNEGLDKCVDAQKHALRAELMTIDVKIGNITVGAYHNPMSTPPLAMDAYLALVKRKVEIKRLLRTL